MKHISQDDAKGLLSPYEAALLSCIVTAWQKWLKISSEFSLPNQRTRTNNIWQFATDEARLLFDGVKGVRIIDGGNEVLFSINDKVVLRFKHVGAGHQPSNYPTKRARAINRQLEVDGIPATAPVLTIGYVLDRHRTDLLDVLVIYFVGKKAEWEYSLMNGGAIVQLPLPTPAAAAAASTKRVRVKPKQGVVVPFRKKKNGQQL